MMPRLISTGETAQDSIAVAPPDLGATSWKVSAAKDSGLGTQDSGVEGLIIDTDGM